MITSKRGESSNLLSLDYKYLDDRFWGKGSHLYRHEHLKAKKENRIHLLPFIYYTWGKKSLEEVIIKLFGLIQKHFP